MRQGGRRHRRHHAHQARHGRGKVQRVLGILPPARAREEVLRLHPLPHPHAAARAEGQRGQRPGEARVRDRRGDEDRQLHGAALAAQEERRHGRGVQQVLLRADA